MTSKALPENVLSTGLEESTLGGRLYAARQKAGMSLYMAANLLGVKPGTLKSWENDRSEPRVNKLNALAGLLGVSPTYFLAGEGNSGKSVSASRGRGEKLLEMMRMEIALAREEQKALTKRIRKLEMLINKL